MVNIRRGTKFFMATPPTETDPQPGDEPQIPQFTDGQWTTLCELLGLDPTTATTDDVVTAVTALADTGAEPTTEGGEKIAASAGPAPTIIDGETWRQMQTTLKIGLRAQNQEKRVQAEQIVDQAIRYGKAQANQREALIQSYNLDPEDTMRRLRKGKEVPFFEIGHGTDPDAGSTPNGWVR
jgi:hypothetical protein